MTTAQLTYGFIIIKWYRVVQKEKDAGVMMDLAFKGMVEVKSAKVGRKMHSRQKLISTSCRCMPKEY